MSDSNDSKKHQAICMIKIPHSLQAPRGKQIVLKALSLGKFPPSDFVATSAKPHSRRKGRF